MATSISHLVTVSAKLRNVTSTDTDHLVAVSCCVGGNLFQHTRAVYANRDLKFLRQEEPAKELAIKLKSNSNYSY